MSYRTVFIAESVQISWKATTIMSSSFSHSLDFSTKSHKSSHKDKKTIHKKQIDIRGNNVG